MPKLPYRSLLALTLCAFTYGACMTSQVTRESLSPPAQARAEMPKEKKAEAGPGMAGVKVMAPASPGAPSTAPADARDDALAMGKRSLAEPARPAPPSADKKVAADLARSSVLADVGAAKARMSTGAMGGAGKGLDGEGAMARRVAPPVADEVRHERSGLQGGSKDDVAQRAEYLKYERDAHARAHRTNVSQRVIIQAEDDLEKHLPNAQVTVAYEGKTLFSGTTYANGKTQFFPKDAGLSGHETVEVTVTSQGRTQSRDMELQGKDQEFSVVMPVEARRAAPVVDVMFVLDTTGSMGDEIARIQLTLLEVAARIQKLDPKATIRYGLTLYRDRGDEYVTRVTDFTSDVRGFMATLQEVSADGGGDTPEAMNEGLYAAIHGAHWTSEKTPNAVRLAILVADAPPHLDYAQDRDYAKEMKEASRRGIKIFPVAASGLDDQGEYIFRQMAHHTMGRFVFITYGGGTSHHVGQFANNNLDDLVVGLVADEMADLTGRPRAQVRALAMAR